MRHSYHWETIGTLYEEKNWYYEFFHHVHRFSGWSKGVDNNRSFLYGMAHTKKVPWS